MVEDSRTEHLDGQARPADGRQILLGTLQADLATRAETRRRRFPHHPLLTAAGPTTAGRREPVAR